MPFESVINSFESGELSPNVYGRTDLQQYRNGAAALTNMIVQPSGAAKKRPGTTHLDDISTTARLIPFQTSATEAYIVELTNGNWRVVDTDGTEIDTGTDADITTASLPTVRYVQSSLDLVLVSRDFAPKHLNFDGTSTWTWSDLSITEPSGVDYPTFDIAAANKLPGAVTFIDQRLVLAGTNNEPNAVFGSEVNGLKIAIDNAAAVDMDANAAASTDADPYAFLILDYGFINISWITTSNVLQNGFLFAGTSAGLYAILGGTSSGALSPASAIVSARRQSTAGCADVQGIVVNNFLMFVDSSKRRIRIAQFNLQSDQFETPRINDLADHLFEADIKEIHYQRAPNSILWVLLETGVVRAFSYDSTGSLGAWVPVEFGDDSTVQSMAVLPGEEEDTVAFCMYNATQDDYTIEKMASFTESDQDEMWYVDSGVRKYNATAFTSMSGLDHLEGEELQVWADGAAHSNVTVSSGSITLTRECNTVIAGRPYTATVTTLPIPDAQDKVKRVDKIFARFADTLGAKAGTDEFEEVVPFRSGDFEMGSQPALYSGLKEIPYFGRHDFDGQITLLSDTPTPFNLLSVITRLEVYG